MSNLKDAITKANEKAAGLPPEQVTGMHIRFKTTHGDLVDYQRLQSAAFAAGKISFGESKILYDIYGGDSPSPDKWEKLTIGEKLVGTQAASQLIGMRMKSFRNPRGGTINKSEVKSYCGFKFGTRVTIKANVNGSAIPIGAKGTVWAMKRRGIPLSVSPGKDMIFIRWDHHGDRSVPPGCLKQIQDKIRPIKPGNLVCPVCQTQNPIPKGSTELRCSGCKRPMITVKVRKR